MTKFCVTIVVEDRKEQKEFNLPSEALICDLKEALAEKEGVPIPNAKERIKLYFKTASGHDLGMLGCQKRSLQFESLRNIPVIVKSEYLQA